MYIIKSSTESVSDFNSVWRVASLHSCLFTIEVRMLCWSESVRRSCLISEISLLLKRPRKVPRMAPESGSGNKNLPFMTVMIDGNGAGGVDGDVVGDVVEMEISG